MQGLLSQLQAQKEKLQKSYTIFKSKTGVKCVEIGDTTYDLVTIDGAGVLVEQDKIYSYRDHENVPMFSLSQGSNSFYFKQTDSTDDDTRQWFEYKYVQVEETPVLVEIVNPLEELRVYVIDDDVKRPRADVIEAAYQPELFDIIPGFGLFLGSQDAAANKDGIDEKGVTHILNVATGVENRYPDEYVYCTLPILDTDTSDITTIFDECFEFIDESRNHGGVLVHCNAGVSRSSSIVIGYIMSRKNMSFQEAYNITKSVKGDIKPNDGFMHQLQNYNP